ncbi:MAG: LysM peptidoglycan-binding domain-containing protein, partial [Microbacterium sp.]
MPRTSTRRPGFVVGLPAALVGSLAVSLSATAAVAVEPEVSAETRGPLPTRIAASASTPRGAAAPTATAAPTAIAAPTAKTSKKTYVVKQGDTVWAISQRYGVSVNKVLKANGLTRSSIIYPGQKLVISGSSATAKKTTKKTTTAKTTATAKTHTVRSGDTVYAIAAKHGVTVKSVLKAN